eukprot:3880722-Lingulodinium_polyedra.AAC.1
MIALVQGEVLTESTVQEHDRGVSKQTSALNQATAICATMLAKKTTGHGDGAPVAAGPQHVDEQAVCG